MSDNSVFGFWNTEILQCLFYHSIKLLWKSWNIPLVSCIFTRWFNKIVKHFNFVSSTKPTFCVYHLNKVFWNNRILLSKPILYCICNFQCPFTFHMTRDFFSSQKIFQFYVLVSKAAILLLFDILERVT